MQSYPLCILLPYPKFNWSRWMILFPRRIFRGRSMIYHFFLLSLLFDLGIQLALHILILPVIFSGISSFPYLLTQLPTFHSSFDLNFTHSKVREMRYAMPNNLIHGLEPKVHANTPSSNTYSSLLVSHPLRLDSLHLCSPPVSF